MSRRPLIVLLGAAALGALAVNVLYSTGDAPIATGDEDEWETSDSEGLEPLRPLDWSDVSAHLASLPESDAERSAFLTRDESLRLAGADVASGSDGPKEGVRLDGTLYGPFRRVAWIDGRPQSEGDPVADYRVAEIEPGAVRLVRGAETLRLEVGRSGAPASGEIEEQRHGE